MIILFSEYGNLPHIPRGTDGRTRLSWQSSHQSWEEVTANRFKYTPAQRTKLVDKILRLSRSLPRVSKGAFDCMRERKAV